jgi:multidrug efflux pump subunit AcrA (membrane-fusion protein)
MPTILSQKVTRIAIGAVLVLGLGGFTLCQRFAPAASADRDTETRATFARRGDLALYASGSGVPVSAESVDVVFAGGDELVELLVRIGDSIEAGQAGLTIPGERDAGLSLVS